MIQDLTMGNPTKIIIKLAIPMIIGNLFQQLYNLVDTIIVGQYVGKEALAAVSSAFTVMVFVTSIIIGLCMGMSVAFAQFFGAGEIDTLKRAITTGFIFVFGVTIILTMGCLLGHESIIRFMRVPSELYEHTRTYLLYIFGGLIFTFIYNAMTSLLRALGDAKTPLYFLVLAAILNVILDLVFVIIFHLDIVGVALATVIAQAVAAVLCCIYSYKKVSLLHLKKEEIVFDPGLFKIISQYAFLTALQQSIMNFGILMVQGLVNSFGTVVMAAFGAAVKIDSFAYMPLQDFGNAFSNYVAQNKGAEDEERIKQGIKSSVLMITVFSAVISIGVWLLAPYLMLIFIKSTEVEVIRIGVEYLHIVSIFYILIGLLFMFYGLYRGMGRMNVSIVLTIISLGTRVALAYILAAIPQIGLVGIWWAIPIGWLLADLVGYLFINNRSKRILPIHRGKEVHNYK